MLLCSRHHTLVHDEVYRLGLYPDRTLDVGSPLTGRTIDGLDQTIDPRAKPTRAARARRSLGWRP